MDFAHSGRVQDLQRRVTAFMDEHVYPSEARFHGEVEENRRKGNADTAMITITPRNA